MSFIVIAACLALQWFLQFTSMPYQWNWAHKYFQWMRQHTEALTKGHALFTVILLILPMVIVASLVFTLIYHLFGYIGYLALSFALLWYCIDVTALKTEPAPTLGTADLFYQHYQKIFAVLFWYFVFGPMGLVLYVVSAALHKEWIDQKYFIIWVGILDWVPVRLTALCFALAGNFGAVFKEWLRLLPHGIADNRAVLTTCGDAAIFTKENSGTANSEAIALIQRSLLIWLAVIALISVGRWIG